MKRWICFCINISSHLSFPQRVKMKGKKNRMLDNDVIRFVYLSMKCGVASTGCRIALIIFGLINLIYLFYVECNSRWSSFDDVNGNDVDIISKSVSMNEIEATKSELAAWSGSFYGCRIYEHLFSVRQPIINVIDAHKTIA